MGKAAGYLVLVLIGLMVAGDVLPRLVPAIVVIGLIAALLRLVWFYTRP